MLAQILNPELWTQGITIMLIGMGIVVAFLVVLVGAINVLTKAVATIDKIWPPVVEEVKQTKTKKTTDDSEIALAIAVARAQG